jgi:signal transduction histidine kinase
MPFFDSTSANMATQLWIAARLLGGASLLAAPLFLRRPLRPGILLLAFGLLTTVLLMSIMAWKVFPACYVEGQGLTAFKITCEYVICFALLVAIALVWRNRNHFDPQVLTWLIASMALTVGSELLFTLYTDVYGITNLLGHYCKIIAFYFLYKAVIETGFAKPFALLLRENRLREEHLRAAKEELDKANAELERRVAERTASLQEATDDLNTFVYSVAHDLRAPSRAQYGFSMMLLESQRDRLSKEGVQCVEKIKQAALKMDALVSSLLAYVGVSREQPVIEAVDVAGCIRQLLHDSAAKIEPANALIHSSQAQGTVLASESSLRRALSHLLDNALKFSKPGQRVEITFRSEPIGDRTRIWIEDNGIGIAPRYHPKLFGVFQRLHGDGQYGGIGIGLALVKRSIQRMGGRVGVESQADQGCRFWIELGRGKMEPLTQQPSTSNLSHNL